MLKVKIRKSSVDIPKGFSTTRTVKIKSGDAVKEGNKEAMRGSIATLGLIFFLMGAVGFGVPILKSIQFNVGCESYLKSAGDAPTIELARNELDMAIQYLEAHDLTSGSSHLLIKNRQANIGYWYKCLCAARKDLNDVDDEKEALRVLRESLLDNGKNGTIVTHPPNIHVYPHQWRWGVLQVSGFCVGLIGIFMLYLGIRG